MLLKHTIYFGIITFLSLLAYKANAGLYGFTQANPYSKQELNSQSQDFPEQINNYRDLMRENVIMLSQFAKSQNPQFEILVHEALPLLEDDIWEYHLNDYNLSRKNGYTEDNDSLLSLQENLHPKNFQNLKEKYIQNIDAIVINNYLCQDKQYTVPQDKRLVSIEYCPQKEISPQTALSYIITDSQYAFKDIKHQPAFEMNAQNISSVQDAKNIAFVLDTSRFKSEYDFLTELNNSNFDVIVISPFFQGKPLSKEEINHLKYKKNGATRKIYAAINVSEADPTKFYWKKDWKVGNPAWLVRPSLVDEQGIITQYWNPSWQKILSAHFKGIMDLGFDGAFLTGLENYQHFEKITPLE